MGRKEQFFFCRKRLAAREPKRLFLIPPLKKQTYPKPSLRDGAAAEAIHLS
jgi:hypothetical protein